MKITTCFLLTISAILIVETNPAIAQWVQSGLMNANVWALALSPNGTTGTNLFAGTNVGGVFLSTDDGTSWVDVSIGLTSSSVVCFLVDGTSLFAGTQGGGVFRTTNNGTSWSIMNDGLTHIIVRSLVLSDANLIAGTSGGVFLSTNNGTNWNQVNSGLGNIDVRALAVKGRNLFAGTYGGGVYLSTNNGTNWTAVNSGFLIPNPKIISLGANGENVFAGTGYNQNPPDLGTLYRSTNDGISWTYIVSDYFVQCYASSRTNMFWGLYGAGVWLSTNNGTSWTAVNSGLAWGTSARSLVISDPYLFAGIESGGVWRRPLSEMIVSVSLSPSQIPTEFALEQNYPNPFNPKTIINFQLPIDNWVTLKVFDPLGREVATLVNEEMKPGAYDRVFNAEGLASGLYFYRLQAGEFVQSKKLLLLR